MLAWWLGAVALAADVRLIVVGDTGYETPVASAVSADVARAAAEGGHGLVRVVATGDLFYRSPPSSAPDCAARVAARYRAFYGAIPHGLTLAVVGNHDVAPDPYDRHVLEPRAWACTEAAFRELGWLAPEDRLGTRLVRLDAGGITADVVLVDWGMFGAVPAGTVVGVPPGALRDDATFRLAVAHYSLPDGLSSGKCPEFPAYRALAAAVPAPDLWLNGHAHHLEARPVGAVLDVTSGAGMDLRPPDDRGCGDVARSRYRYLAGDARPATKVPVRGGYTLVDLDVAGGAGRVTVTPVGCTAEGCAPIREAVVTCTRRDGERGVVCH